MHTGIGTVFEVVLRDGLRHARIKCPPELIPGPGQYVVAGEVSFPNSLPVSLFYTESAPQGFITSAPIPDTWDPGLEINLRGPLGRGFELPVSARKVGLVAFDTHPATLIALIPPAIKQKAAVVLVCDDGFESLPDEVEVQPLSSLQEVMFWADYVAFDVVRENVPALKESLMEAKQLSAWEDAQVLVHTSIPCGGIAECGVCAVITKSNWKMACKDGPVFAFGEL